MIFLVEPLCLHIHPFGSSHDLVWPCGAQLPYSLQLAVDPNVASAKKEYPCHDCRVLWRKASQRASQHCAVMSTASLSSHSGYAFNGISSDTTQHITLLTSHTTSRRYSTIHLNSTGMCQEYHPSRHPVTPVHMAGCCVAEFNPIPCPTQTCSSVVALVVLL